jgi:hypothetical protein
VKCNSVDCDNDAKVKVRAIVEIDGEEVEATVNYCVRCYDSVMTVQKMKEKWR